MKINRILLFICSAFLCGCALPGTLTRANDYANYYNNEGYNFTPNKEETFVKLVDTTEVDYQVAKYASKGYIVIGVSKFTTESTQHPDSYITALKLANAKGATLVILGIKYKGTVERDYSYSVPHTTPISTSGMIGGKYYSNTTYVTTYTQEEGHGSYSQYEHYAYFMRKQD